MSLLISEIGSTLLLVTALSIDTFTVSLLYGSSKVKLSLASIVVINVISTLLLTASLLAGIAAKQYIPEAITKWICFAILFCVGFSKLFDSSIKALIKKKQFFCKKIAFSISGLYLVLNIYADPNNADIDKSHDISVKEAIALALALSIDGLGVGFGAALAQLNILLTILFSFVIGMIAVKIGSRLGNLIASKAEVNLSWISGLLMIILAFLKL